MTSRVNLVLASAVALMTSFVGCRALIGGDDLQLDRDGGAGNDAESGVGDGPESGPPPDSQPPPPDVDAGALFDAPDVDAGPVPTSSLVVNNGYACAIRGGTLYCWGAQMYGRIPRAGIDGGSPTPMPAYGPGGTGTFQTNAFDLGSYYMAAIDQSTGRAFCGEFDFFGRCANSSILHGTTITSEHDMGRLVAIWTAATFVCARNDQQTVFCWGDDQSGELTTEAASRIDVDGGRYWTSTAFEVPSLKGALQIALGGYHGCALMPDRSVSCWGQNDYRQTGTSTTTSCAQPGGPLNPCLRTPTKVSGLPADVKQLAAGYSNTCALAASTGAVYCWGRNDSAQLGKPGVGAQQCTDNGGDASPPALCTETPQQVSGVLGASFIAVGDVAACALVSGQVLCWGENQNDILGRGDNATSAAAPVLREDGTPLTGATEVSVGAGEACALTSVGLYCWGNKLGDTGQWPNAHPTAW